MQLYSMKRVCEKTGLSYDTLKFYCNEGLIPNVKRDKNNRRLFDKHDVAWIDSLSCLRKCNMSIAEMKEYMQLCLTGESTIPARQKILEEKLKSLHQDMAELQASIDFIHWKQRFYNDVLKGKRKYYSNIINSES